MPHDPGRQTSMDAIDALEALLERMPEGPMKDALREQRPELAVDLARDYLAADAAGRTDMDAFFASEGPRRVHEAKLKIDDAIPTSRDLARWGSPRG